MDLKNLLYSEIDRMGSSSIKQKLLNKNENSKFIIEELLKNCMNSINNKALSDSEWVSLAEALMHYLLTIMVIPSQRKITINGLEVGIMIPSARDIYKILEQVIIIQFCLTEDETIKNVIEKLNAIQPLQQNIWIVSFSSIDIPKPLRNYVISNSKTIHSDNVFPFSQIMIDIVEHVDRINYSGFKIL